MQTEAPEEATANSDKTGVQNRRVQWHVAGRGFCLETLIRRAVFALDFVDPDTIDLDEIAGIGVGDPASTGQLKG